MNITGLAKYSLNFKQWTSVGLYWRQGVLLGCLLSVGWGLLSPVAAASLSPTFNPMLSTLEVALSPVALPTAIENAIRQDLARRTKIKADLFNIQKATQQTWPDGCLGLGKSNEFCTQALVTGWRVIMQYQQKTWVYRTDDTGSSLRLEK